MNALTTRALLWTSAFLFLVCAVTGCQSIPGLGMGGELVVGVTPDYAPLIFKQGDELVGMEVDLAKELSTELNRPIRMVELPWDHLPTALSEGSIEMIMSGMTITPARKLRIQFSDSYLETGLLPMVRRGEESKYATAEDVVNSLVTIGVKKGTTAEMLVKEKFPNASLRRYMYPQDAAVDLQRNRVEMVIHDGPAIAWLSSELEADLKVLQIPLTRDYLAWGLRRGDSKLLRQVNNALAQWKADGTLDAIVSRWLPYREAWQLPAGIPAPAF